MDPGTILVVLAQGSQLECVPLAQTFLLSWQFLLRAR